MEKLVVDCTPLSRVLAKLGIAFFSIFFIVGVVTNIYLILLIGLKRKFWKNAYIYIAQINFSAMLFIIIGTIDIKTIDAGYFSFSHNLCRVSAWILESVFMGEMMILACLTYERYLAVFKPLIYCNNVRFAFIKSGCCWLAAFTTGIAFFFCYRVKIDDCNVRTCTYDSYGSLLPRIFFSIEVVIIYVIPLFLMIFVYSKIIFWKMKIIIQENPNSGRMTRKERLAFREHREFMSLIRLSIGIVSLFFITWTPFLITRHIYIFNPNAAVFARRVCQLLLSAFPAFNAIVCILTNSLLLNETKKIFNMTVSSTIHSITDNNVQETDNV